MTECSNGEVRDLLPDYIAERSTAADQAMLDGHLAGCASCRDEMAMLRVARAVRPHAIEVNVSRIVAALPARPASLLHLVPSDSRGRAREQTAPARGTPLARSVQRRVSMSGVWKAAAMLAVAALGGWSVLAIRGESGAVSENGAPTAAARSTPLMADSAQPAVVVAIGETLDVSTAGRSSAIATPPRLSTLSLGDLSEYSDEELQRVLERLDQWDGATSADRSLAPSIVSGSVRGTL